MAVSTFTPTHDPRNIVLGNKAKVKKGKENEDITIPVIFLPGSEVCEKVDLLHAMIGDKLVDLTKDQIHSKFNGKVDIRLKKYTETWSSHMCRKVYSRICHRNYTKLVDYTTYLQDILGHEMEDTAKSYTNVVVKFDVKGSIAKIDEE